MLVYSLKVEVLKSNETVSTLVSPFFYVFHTDLEHTVVVHLLQGESEALSQHTVQPALHDGRHAEPVQRELPETQHITLLFTYSLLIMNTRALSCHVLFGRPLCCFRTEHKPKTHTEDIR